MVRISAAVIVLVCLSSAPFVQFSVRLLHRPYDTTSWAYLYPYGFAAALGICVVAARAAVWRDRTIVLRELAPVLAFASWALLSALWTDSPTRTPTEALLMSGLLLTGVYFGGSLQIRSQIVALFVAMQLLAIGSLVQRWLWPEHATNDAGWIGLFGSRNTLGPIGTLAVLSAVAWWAMSKRGLAETLAVLVLGSLDVVLAYRAGSDTAWLALAVALGAVVAARAIEEGVRRGVSRRLLVAFASGLLVILAGVIAVAGSTISAKLGKGTTFSGRREVWSYVVDAVRDRPLLGFGYSSFWDAPANTQQLLDETGAAYNAAHNSFLEVALWLGLVGLALVLLIVVKSFVSVWRGLTDGAPHAEWWLALVAFAFVENLTESMIAYHSVFWVLIVAGAYSSTVNRTWLGSSGRRSFQV